MDFQIPLDIKSTLSKYGYTWFQTDGWGNYIFPFLFPQVLFHLLISGFNINFVGKSIILLSFTGGIISYYLFISKTVVKSNHKSFEFHLAFLVSAFYFLFNADIVRRLYQPGFFKGYLFIPLFLYLLTKYFHNKNFIDKYLVTISILFPLIFASSPHYFVYYILIFAILSIFTLLTSKSKKIIIIKSFVGLSIIFLISSYFILPFLRFPKSPTESGYYLFKDYVFKIDKSLWNIHPLAHTTLTAGWINLSDTFNPELLYNIPWLTLGLVFFLMGILTVFWDSEILKKHISNEILMLIYILFSFSFVLYLGYFSPISGIISGILFKLPIGWAFRAINRIGGIVAFSISVLIFAFIYVTLLRIRNNILKYTMSGILLILIIFYIYPVQNYAFNKYIINTKLPKDYLICFNMLKNSKDNIISVIFKEPLSIMAKPFWTEKRIGFPLENSLTTVLTHAKEKDRYFLRALYKEITSSLAKILKYTSRVYDIKYIILHNDLLYDLPYRHKSVIRTVLKEITCKQIYSGDYLELFEMSNNSGKFYIKKPIIYTNPVHIYDYGSSMVLDDLPIIGSSFPKDPPAEVKSFTKINPTLWKVKVSAKRPFMLSFAEVYDSLWEIRVYKDGEKVQTVKSIPLYSVMNGFWIDETGELEIAVRYKPQDWFEIGLLISALTFIGCFGYLFYDWRKSKKSSD